MQIPSFSIYTFIRPGKLAVLILGVSSMLASGFIYAHDQSAGNSEAAAEPSEKGRKHQRHSGGKRGHHEKMALMMMTKIDANGDGQVDLTEFLSHSEERFHAMDINDDGVVTDEERRESHKIIRKKHKQARNKGREAFEQAMDE